VEPPSYDGEDLAPNGQFRLEIHNTGGGVPEKGVTSYQRTDRIDPQDFRLLPDIEGPDFFDVSTPLLKLTGFYDQKLIIERGVFYTAETTVSTFRRSDVLGAPLQLGPIAYLVGVKINLASNEYAQLVLQPKPGGPSIPPRVFRPQFGLREIHISNTCFKDGQPCEDSDFHHHFKSLENPQHRQRFLLETAIEVRHEHPCAAQKRFDDYDLRSTDPAPCASAGYGQTPGLP